MPRHQADPLEGALRALRGGGAGPASSGDCLDDDAVAALVEGSLEPGDRAAALSHVARCGRCRRAVASLARARADREVAREVATLDGSAARRVLRIAVPVAAAALLLVAVWPRPADDAISVHRSAIVTTAPPPVTLSPVGTVAEAAALRWSAVDGADRYRVTLFDRSGRIAYETELGDTVAPLPDSVTLAPGALYLWRVEARTGFDRWVGSELIEFTVVARERR